MVSWLGIGAPAGTPDAVVRRVHEVVTRILSRPDIREKIAAYGGEPLMADGAQMLRIIAAETPVWAKFAKEAGIEPE
jgi:tripartite-type tricarboxylate transporter receptor subunit TctC